MPLSNERIAYLLEAYTSQKATAREEQELMEWIQEAPEDSELKAYIEGLWEQRQPATGSGHVNWDQIFNNVIQSDKVFSIAPQPKRKLIRWPRVAAAAAILVLISTATYFLLSSRKDHPPIAKTEQQTPVNDITPPVTNKATLTLANGKVIILDSAGTGSLAKQGAGNASKVNEGELAYTATSETKVEYHTLHVPKGSKPMQLQLADGSEVWLNAASSITFPNVFTGNERKVAVTGEAYFEVAKNAAMPFKVSKGQTVVTVLGTHFNVNAYDDESDIKVTLLEGSVKVTNAVGSVMIQPGQQARITSNLKPQAVNDIDVEQVMAWKNGRFEFNETDIQTVMRQIERWYDVEIVYDGKVTQHFNGSIPRQVNTSKVLQMLEKTGGVRFSIDGNKVMVKKY